MDSLHWCPGPVEYPLSRPCRRAPPQVRICLCRDTTEPSLFWLVLDEEMRTDPLHVPPPSTRTASGSHEPTRCTRRLCERRKGRVWVPPALQARICTLHVRPFSLPRPGSGPPPFLGLTSSLNFRALVVLWSEHVLVHFRRSSHGARADLARLEDRSRTPWKVAGTKQTCVSHTWMNAHPRGTDR